MFSFVYKKYPNKTCVLKCNEQIKVLNPRFMSAQFQSCFLNQKKTCFYCVLPRQLVASVQIAIISCFYDITLCVCLCLYVIRVIIMIILCSATAYRTFLLPYYITVPCFLFMFMAILGFGILQEGGKVDLQKDGGMLN